MEARSQPSPFKSNPDLDEMNFIFPLDAFSWRRCSEPRAVVMTSSQYAYKVRPRKDRRGLDLISDALPFGRLWYAEPDAIINAIGYAKTQSFAVDHVAL